MRSKTRETDLFQWRARYKYSGRTVRADIQSDIQADIQSDIRTDSLAWVIQLAYQSVNVAFYKPLYCRGDLKMAVTIKTVLMSARTMTCMTYLLVLMGKLYSTKRYSDGSFKLIVHSVPLGKELFHFKYQSLCTFILHLGLIKYDHQKYGYRYTRDLHLSLNPRETKGYQSKRVLYLYLFVAVVIKEMFHTWNHI